MKSNNLKKAFTLAEILIVLTIIGVMAVMTIPSLIQGTNSQQKVTLFKKAFNALTNAYATEFAVKAAPTAASDANALELFKGLASQLNVKYYLVGGVKKFNVTEVTTENIGSSWIVTEDGIAYKVVANSTNTCKGKLAVNGMLTSGAINTATTGTCFNITVNIDAAKESNPCYNDTDNDAADINNLTCNETDFYVTTDGITSGNPDCVITGRIISGTQPRVADNCTAPANP